MEHQSWARDNFLGSRQQQSNNVIEKYANNACMDIGDKEKQREEGLGH